MKIGIIGAGLSGIIAARELVRQGHDVELIEKSRSVESVMDEPTMERFISRCVEKSSNERYSRG